MSLTGQEYKNKEAIHLEDQRSAPASSHFDDLSLWSLFKKGHEGAFKQIYDRYYSELYNYGLLFYKDKELIEDSIQDLFIDLRKSGENLSDTDNIKFYLFKSLKWKLGFLAKKANRFSLVKSQYSLSFSLNFEVSHETILINQQLDREVKRVLSQELNDLPRRQKEAIYYFYFEGFSYQELTKIMKLGSVKASRNLIYKAISSLKSSEKLRSRKALRKLF